MKSISVLLLGSIATVHAATFKAHEIGYFNLMELKAARDLLCLVSCPNIAAFESAEASTVTSKPANGGGIVSSADVIASVVSTIGGPSNVLAYYSAQTKMNLNLNQVLSLDQANKFLTGDFSGAFSASGSAEVMGYVIDKVIEFRSKDKSGVYNVANDEIVSHVSYGSQSWGPMSVVVQNGITNITVATKDGAHTFQWKMAGQYASIENGAVLTPNSTKLYVTIKYPFTAQDTNVAVRMVMVGASASGAADANVDMNRQQVTNGNSYISWVGKASTNAGLINVAATAAVDESATYFNSKTNMLSTVNAQAQAAGKAQANVKITYFSFPATSASEYIYWDPAIGYGQNPAVADGLSGWAIALIVIGCVGVVAIVALVVIRRQKAKKSNGAFSSLGFA